MATVRNTITMQDRMTPVLRTIIKSLQSTVDAMAGVDHVSDKAFKQVKRDVQAASDAINEFNNGIDELPPTQRKVEDGFKGWQRAIIVANQGISLMKSIIGRLGLIDFGKAFDRMDIMKSFERTMTHITGSSGAAKVVLDEINEAVLGTAYGLDVAAKSAQNLITRDVGIKKSVGLIKTWADAVAFYGKGTNEQLETVSNAMGKMLSKGRVDMMQLDRMTDVGINAVQMYAKATGKSTAKVQNDLSKGVISANEFLTTVTKAMEEGTNGVLKVSGAAKEAGGSWATTFANMRAAGARGVISFIEAIDSGLERLGFGNIMSALRSIGANTERTLKSLGQSIEKFMANYGWLVKAIIGSILIIGKSFTWIITNLDKMLPIIIFVGLTMASVWWTVGREVEIAGKKSIMTGKQMLVAGWEGFKGGIIAAKGWLMANWQTLALSATVGILVFALQNFHTWGKYVVLIVGALALAFAIWKITIWALNTALYACPIVWILTAVIAVIAIVITIFILLGNTVEKVFGVIVGIVYVAAAFMWNIIVGVINAIIQFLWTVFVEHWIGAIEWVLNVFKGGFDSFGDGVKNLLGNIISWFLSLGKVVTKIIDAIFGTNWTAGLNELQKNVLKWGKNENAITLEREAPTALNRMAYSKAWDSGNVMGQKLGGKMVDVAEGLNNKFDKDTLDNFANPEMAGGELDSVGKIKDDVSITDDDIKLLKDVAATEFINKFTTLRPEMSIQFGDVRETADVNKILEVIEDMVEEAYASVLVGEGA